MGIYVICCALFYVLAVYAWFSVKPFGVRTKGKRLGPQIKDVIGYNHAVAKLLFVYGTLLVLSGLPILLSMDPVITTLISVLGILAATCVVFALAMKIDEKYRKG